MNIELVDNTAALGHLLDTLTELQDGQLHLYMDLEGNDLYNLACRHQRYGTRGVHHCWQHWTHDETDEDVVKVFFDIRNDSDALYSLYGVEVSGVQDVQLMELATRNFSKRCVNSLKKCIENDAPISYEEKRQWSNTKEDGRRLFDPAVGGSYSVFDQRPLGLDIQKYCVHDVCFLPSLRRVYRARLCDVWWVKIEEETAARIELSHSASYNGKGRHMALGPQSWMGWSPTAAERRSRQLLEDNAGPPSKPNSGRSTSAISTTTLEESSPSPNVGDDHPNVIATALHEVMANLSSTVYRESDEYEQDMSFSSRYHSSRSDEEDGGGGDFAACDKECGYCGRCMY